ncbi:MAG: AbrB/MazE/SpoVT family DNA-binding domain-containing protein [Burkholderiaceae bacterium]|nr:AbrB/MazE/SpoVT family DNA-binding domain-containing protein [Burkholderiaceae bacterium]
MSTHLTNKGQVTIPKPIRDALQLLPGTPVDFAVNAEGEVVLRRAEGPQRARAPRKDRFDAVRGRADVPWRTEDLMKLLRRDDSASKSMSPSKDGRS